MTQSERIEAIKKAQQLRASLKYVRGIVPQKNYEDVALAALRTIYGSNP